MNFRLFITRRGGATAFCRLTAASLIPALLLTTRPVLAEVNSATDPAGQKPNYPSVVHTPKSINVNRKLPAIEAPEPLSLSNAPTDEDIFHNSPFPEPLVPIGGSTTQSENHELAQALIGFTKRKERDDFSSLEGFIGAHAQSAWKISLLTDLGLLYRQTGWYGKAMDTWQEAWTAGQSLRNMTPQGKVIIDRALVELLVMNARVGRMDSLASLIQVADKRQLVGSSKERVEAAKQALVLMHTHSESAFRCGPAAVEKIRNMVDHDDPAKWRVNSDVSTTQGTSLAQLQTLATKLSMDMIPVKRTPGSPIPVPSVIHWKVGHFAAAIGFKNGLVHLADPTFGRDIWISPRALDAEASGYFLIKRQSLPVGWTFVDQPEALTIWGKGQADGSDDSCDSNKDDQTCNNDSPPDAGTAEDSSSVPSSKSTPGSGNSTDTPLSATGGTDSEPSPQSIGMASASAHMMLASLKVEDTPLGYRPPIGPQVAFHISYCQREAYQPSLFTYSNLGPLWTFNWLTYITDDPSNPGGGATQYLSDGGTLTYTGYSSSTQSYAPQLDTGAVLKITGSSSYELDLADGSKQIFNAATTGNGTSRNIFLTQTFDPAGNGLTFSYDGYYRLIAVTDAQGQVTTLAYGLTSDMYKITQVTDPFGRTAILNYNPDGSLQSSTDMMGMASSYAYSNEAMTSMTTPYGTTTFNVGQDTLKRWVQINDPQGGQERVETWLDATSLFTGGQLTAPPINDVPFVNLGTSQPREDNNYIQYRNTFYWNKKAMVTSPGNYSQAQLVHWLETGTNSTIMTGEVESYKAPLENRVYYNYPGQSTTFGLGTSGEPIATVRVIDNGSTQVTQQFSAQYNSLNLPTQATTPPVTLNGTTNSAGRITTYSYYSNNVDLQYVYRKNQSGGQDTLSSATYNSQHEPLTVNDTANQQTQYTYFTNGELYTVTNAKGEERVYAYTNNYLTSITEPVTGAATSFTYDGLGRVRTVTDVNGYTLTYDYDSLNRVTAITYPDGTYEQNVYSNLDLTQHKDRLNRWTRYFYNAVEQLVGVEDPQGRVTSYDRCACGELKGMIDPYGHRTSWNDDIEGRLVTKTYADGTSSSTTVNYSYVPSTSWLQSITDATGQVSTYTYNLDNTVQQVAYSNATVATPTVAYGYDLYYPRLAQISNGSATTQYAYYGPGVLGGGQVHTDTSPIPNSQITYSYDALGRATTTSINGSSVTVGYDGLDRVQSETDSALSSTAFGYSYVGNTPRVQSVSYPNGQSASFSYQTSPSQDFRLTDITNYKTGTTVLSKFDYTYNANGTLATWQQQTDGNTPTLWTYAYDKADQLLSAVRTSGSTVLAQDVYGYDLAGNRITAQNGLSVQTTVINNPLNEISSVSGGGQLQFSGNLSKPAAVTVSSTMSTNSATVNLATDTFAGNAKVGTGTNVVTVVANDYNGNSVTNKYQVVVPANSATTPAYDGNGNLINNGAGQTYAWDAKNELVTINYTGSAIVNGVTQTQFTYDGLGRRVANAETTSSGTTTKQYVWEGDQMAEERDSSGNANVTKRFFGLGEQIAGTAYYLTQDHLGSVRELTNTSGVTQARYDYDPYGVVSTVGTVVVASDFQFAGMYEYATSGLNLTLYRAYDPNSGRWLSRDPMGEGSDATLYSYVRNNPINFWDPFGLDYTQSGPALSLVTDTNDKTHPKDSSHQNQLAPGSPGNGKHTPGVVVPEEAKGVNMGDPAYLHANGKVVKCIAIDRSTNTYSSHTNKPESNPAAAKAAGLKVKGGSKEGEYPSAGPGDAAVPASIYFPTATNPPGSHN